MPYGGRDELHMFRDEDAARLQEVRLDVWLDVACLFKSRSEAQRACKGGKITIKGQTVKPNRLVRLLDELVIRRPLGRIQRITVKALAVKHVPKADARHLYDDVSPAPTAEEIEVRRVERLYRSAMAPPRAPDKRERRQLRHLKGRE
jgi:ribosome-associated heat shock protein Hsp15